MPKINIWKMIILLSVIIIVIVGLFILPNFICLFPMEYEEILRVQSPDGKVDAVLMRGNAGAMSSFHYGLYIVPSWSQISNKDINNNRYKAVCNAERMEGEKIVWLKNKVLEIQYSKAQAFEFIDHISPLPKDMHYEVEIRKSSPTDNISAGGISSSDKWLKNYIYNDQNSPK
jgi:hypothetical protein